MGEWRQLEEFGGVRSEPDDFYRDEMAAFDRLSPGLQSFLRAHPLDIRAADLEPLVRVYGERRALILLEHYIGEWLAGHPLFDPGNPHDRVEHRKRLRR